MSDTRLAALIGRDHELGTVTGALAAARHGQGSLVALTGEAGIGKTRLAAETVAHATRSGMRTAWGSAWPGGGAPPLWPWQDLLAELGTSDPDQLLTLHRPGDAERFLRFRAVAAELTRICARTPTLIVLDDVHAMDPAAVLLARFVGRSLRHTALLILVTCRDHPADDPMSNLDAVLADSVQVPLLGLTGRDLAALAQQCRPGSPPLDAGYLAELTGGNPLLVREALAAGASDRTAPDRVRTLLRQRLGGLSEGQRTILAAAAVVGPIARDATVAYVAGAAVDEVVDVRNQARNLGVLGHGSAGRFEFAHDLMRTAVLDETGDDEVGRLHAAAASALAADEDADTARRQSRLARHLLIAARAGASPRDAAVAAARLAAAAERSGGSHERSAAILRDAIDLHRAPSEVESRLWIELAQSYLEGGHLLTARSTFRSALQAADATAADVAEALIGLGGIWVFEQRDTASTERYHNDLVAALADVDGHRPDLAGRLRVRLEAERVYLAASTVDRLRREVDGVRSSGNARDLAESLSLYNHVLLGPHRAALRREAVDELGRVAASTGDTMSALMSALWRTVDEFLLGSPTAERRLTELRHRADALRVEAVLYIVELIDVMLAVRAGRLADAEAAAQRCAERGVAVGDADATGYLGAHLLNIRWLQGRGAEMLPLAREIAAAPTMVAAHPVYPAAVAALAADGGPCSHEEARRQLDAIEIASIETSSNWLLILACIIEAAVQVNDHRSASTAYDALAPFAALPVLASLAVACFGSVERSLGIAALVLGRIDVAVGHLERAVEANRRLGNRPALAISRGDLGLALTTRARSSDQSRANALLAQATAALDDMGCAARADRYRHPPAPASPTASMRLVGSSWELVVDGRRHVVADRLGMRYLARLVSTPGVEVPVDDLAQLPVIERTRHTLLDAPARAQYRERVQWLRAELQAADTVGDVKRAHRAETELAALLRELGATTALGGRQRNFADARERSRTAVRKAIQRAIAAIAQSAPELAEALSGAVHTGLMCRYEPVGDAPPIWQVDTGN